MDDATEPFNYHPTTPGAIYSIAPGIEADDVRNYLEARLGQLYAMLATTFGEGGEAFRTYNDDIQDNYMWACAALAEECRALFKRLGQGDGIAVVSDGGEEALVKHPR